jgi:Na+-translocating ferredoxin:NAD+ oxidoreductase RnfG subunit
MHILFWSFLILFSGLPKNIQKKVDKEIKMVFSIESFSLKAKMFSSEVINGLPAKFEDNNLFEIIDKDSLIGYAYVSKAASKTDKFDYLILFDTDFIIVKSKVLIYREDYGGEIGSKRWLKQFIGKTKDDTLKLNDNIVAISGATISVRSMTKAVNDVLASIKILYQNNQL